MINILEVNETNKMITQENLDVRTITLGISLLDCADDRLEELNRKIYDKITRAAERLVSTGEEIEKEYGIPIVNKRISITPVSLVGERRAPARRILSRWPIPWTGPPKKWGLISWEDIPRWYPKE